MKENVVEKRNFIKNDYLYISTNWSLTKETNKYITLITFLKIKPKRIDTKALLKEKKNVKWLIWDVKLIVGNLDVLGLIE